MTPRERVLAAFEGRRVDRVVWQPRIVHWYEVNKACGTLPERYRDMDVLEVYDDLGASPRSYHWYNSAIRCVQGQDVEVSTRDQDGSVVTTYATPRGTLREVERRTEHGTASYHTEYLVKNVEDLQVLADVVSKQTFEFDRGLYSEAAERLGDRAESIVTVPWLPLLRLIIGYAGLARTVIMLRRHPGEVEEFIRVMDESDDKRFRLISSSPIKIVNLGDNIHHDLIPPPLFKKYALPYYKKRTGELHRAGKLCTSHWDGYVRRLLPFAKETGLDGIECLTPEPQGDVSLEELKKALDGIVLVDGIPATHFLPLVSYSELETFVHRILDMFSPRIILGISDMLPPGGDIEKVRFVSRTVEEYTPP